MPIPASSASSGGPDRLRIAFVTDALVPYHGGGAERRVHEVATRLAGRHEIYIVTWRFWGDQRTIERDGMTLHGIGAPRLFYGEDGHRTVREGLEFAARLPLTLARLAVDVVDVSATPYLPLFGAWLGTRFNHVPVVATWHEYWDDYWLDYLAERPIVARLARRGEHLARRLGEQRVAVSPFTARRLAHAAPGRPSDVVIGNGVDSEAFATATPARARTDVVFVGRLIEEKGVDRLLEALALVGSGVRAVIVGDGPERPRLEALAAQLGLARDVRFVGRVPDSKLAALLRAATLFVLPSRREGFGIAVLEAQAAGLVPIVVRSPHSAATDLIADGVDGVICDADPRAIADAIGGLLTDQRRLRMLAQAARESATARDWDRIAEAAEEMYRRVAATTRSRSQRARPTAWRLSVPGEAARERVEP